MEEIWEIDLERKYIPTDIPIDTDIIGIGFMWWDKFLKESIMLKCKHNEDCSLYPACGHTCGVPVEELLRMKSQHIRDMEHVINDLAGYQLRLMEQSLYKIKDLIKKPDYIPACPYGYRDCVSDPAYIRKYNPKWWEELGMPTECSQAKYYEEDCSCQWYDDEDK